MQIVQLNSREDSDIFTIFVRETLKLFKWMLFPQIESDVDFEFAENVNKILHLNEHTTTLVLVILQFNTHTTSPRPYKIGLIWLNKNVILFPKSIFSSTHDCFSMIYVFFIKDHMFSWIARVIIHISFWLFSVSQRSVVAIFFRTQLKVPLGFKIGIIVWDFSLEMQSYNINVWGII